MVDLETLGTVPGCSILSIGAVEFFPDMMQLGQEFYVVINTSSCEEHFLTTDQSTVEWWQRQSPEAQAVVDEARVGGVTLPKALESFNSWRQGLGPVKEERLYGNGADFDNPILRVAYDAAKVKPYGGSYGGRCYRTLKNLDELLGNQFRAHKMFRNGTHHNALDDAKSQARHLMEIVQAIRSPIAQQTEV